MAGELCTLCLAIWLIDPCRNLDLCGSNTFTKFQVLKGSSFSYVSEWNPGLFLSCRALKKFRFSLLIQINPEKGFCPSRCYDKMEQTNHIRPYLTLFCFRLCLFSQSWCTARLNILLCAHAMVNLYLFSIRSIVYRKTSSGHQACGIMVLLVFSSVTSLLLKVFTPRSGAAEGKVVCIH